MNNTNLTNILIPYMEINEINLILLILKVFAFIFITYIIIKNIYLILKIVYLRKISKSLDKLCELPNESIKTEEIKSKKNVFKNLIKH